MTAVFGLRPPIERELTGYSHRIVPIDEMRLWNACVASRLCQT